MDTDGDGLSDAYEQKIGTDPLVADTDHDGLSDGDEVARGLNPRLVDSNNDGIADGFAADHDLLGGPTVPGGTGVPGGLDVPGGAGVLDGPGWLRPGPAPAALIRSRQRGGRDERRPRSPRRCAPPRRAAIRASRLVSGDDSTRRHRSSAA